MNKRAIIILSVIFVLIIATLGFLLWSRSRSAATTATTNTTNNTSTTNDKNGTNNTSTDTDTANLDSDTNTDTTSDTTNTTPIKALTKVIDDKVTTPVLFYQGNGISYFNQNGQLTQVDLKIQNGQAFATNKRSLNLPQKTGITKVLWPSSGNNFLVLASSTLKPVWSYFGSSTGQYTDLPSQIGSLVLSPDNTKIYYVWQGANNKNTLNISDPNGTNYKKLADIFNADSQLSISPDGKMLLFYSENNPGDKNQITLVTADGQAFKTVAKEGYNWGVLWSPDSKWFLYGKRDPQTRSLGLWLGNPFTGEEKDLKVIASPESAVWSADGRFVYVSGRSASGSSETISKVELSTLTKTEILANGNFTAKDLFLSKTEDFIFFRNTFDGALYGVSTVATTDGFNK